MVSARVYAAGMHFLGSRGSNFGLPHPDLEFHDFLADVILIQNCPKTGLRDAKQYKKSLTWCSEVVVLDVNVCTS